MAAVEISLYALAIGFCLFSLWWINHFFAQFSLFFLKLFLLLKAGQFLLHWLTVHPGTSYKPAILGTLMASAFLLAPCLWLFAKEISSGKRPSLTALTPADWGVIALGALLCVPLIAVATNSTHMTPPDHKPSIEGSSWVHGTMLLCIGLYLYQVPRYLYASLKVLKIQISRNELLFSNTDDMPLQILRVLLWVMLASWLFILLRTAFTAAGENSSELNFALIFAEIAITLWLLIEALKRCSPAAHSNQELSQALVEQSLPNPSSSDNSGKYQKSALDDTVRTRISDKINTRMQEEELFKQSNLKLVDLCTAINENTHYVSQVINETLNTNFYELVNSYRIESAKQLLIDSPKTSILDIAIAVGFNSKSTFNAAFKRITHMTPTQYRTEHSAAPH